MYATNPQTPMHGNMNSYHWNHPLRVSSHDRITIPNHPTDSHWYSDSVLFHSAPTVSSQHLKIESGSSHGSPNKSLNNQLGFPAQPGPRAVIPSKRAAQNRAAQRAFRQRKERYVKDLEKKAKMMDEWKAELDQLRHQNQELRENTMRLEKKIHHQEYASGNKMLSPITSPVVKSEVIPAPVVIVMERDNNKKKIKTSELPPRTHTSFLPVNLRAHEHKVVYNSPTTSCSSSSSICGLEDAKIHYSKQMTWNTTSGSDFDHFDFISTNHGGQALDDLCSVIQSRPRTEYSMPSQLQQHHSYVMQLNSPRNDHTTLMSRTY